MLASSMNCMRTWMKMLHRARAFWRPAFLVAALLALAVPCGALMEALSTERLTQAAALVVKGKVAALQSSWSDDKRRILTRVRLRVEEIFKGAAPAGDLAVEFPGGEVGGIGMRVSDMPAFHLGEEVILFLRPSGRPRAAGAFTIVGKAQGKYSIAPDGTATKGGFDVTGDRAVVGDRLPVTELIGRIRKAAGR